MAEFCSTVSWCFRDRKAKDMILTLTLHTVCDGPVLQVFEFLFPLSRVDEKGETFMLHDHSRIFVLSFPAPVVFLPSWGPHSQCVVSKREPDVRSMGGGACLSMQPAQRGGLQHRN